jgi:prepilin-type N-terminal cleavage/methylation domain-containing protein
VKSNKPGQSPRGFTLLEVLVAMTIVGLGVVTLLQVFSQGLRLGSRSTAQTEAVAAGARVMDELLARRKFPEADEAGRLAGGERWNAQVRTSRDADALNLGSPWELKELSVELILPDGSELGRRVEFKTLRLARKNNP